MADKPWKYNNTLYRITESETESMYTVEQQESLYSDNATVIGRFETEEEAMDFATNHVAKIERELPERYSRPSYTVYSITYQISNTEFIHIGRFRWSSKNRKFVFKKY